MDAKIPGALQRRKPFQRLIGMIMLVFCMIGLIAVSPLIMRPLVARAAGNVQINAGGPVASPFIADTDFSDGSTASVSHTIDTSGVSNPAPMAVYQSNRYGNFTYTIPGLTASSAYTVRLHFAEEYWTRAGQRVFNVSINGQQVLTNFDILATTGAEYKAVVEQFSATANSSGSITIQFVTVKDNAQINGIEVPGSSSPTPTPTSTSTPTNAPTPIPTSTPITGPPNFGPNTYIFTPSMPISQSRLRWQGFTCVARQAALLSIVLPVEDNTIVKPCYATLQVLPLSVKPVGFGLLPLQLPLKPGLTEVPGARVLL